MTSSRSELRFCALFGLLISLSVAISFAQTVTGSISGTVKDSSGAVLPNAQIQVLNQDTGIARTLQTDTAGHYSALLLALGNYQVTATLQGFQTEVRSGIELTVGREAVVDLTMSVGAMTQKVEVVGEAALINTTSSTVSGLVVGEQIRELPLNGRSYNDLALLEPGVIYNHTTGSSEADGYGVRMSVNGDRSNNNLYLIDGSVINDNSQTAGSVNADSLGAEAIREFTVLTHNYSAEFGHSAGGVVNAVTRSGTNDLHGSLYEFLRNSDLDARDFFQPGSIAPFKRNQFGGSIGGKIKKDKLFYFGNYEGFRQELALLTTGSVPDAEARLGFIPINGQLTNVGVSPLIQPYLALYALPNGHDNGDGTAIWNYNYPQPIIENYYLERVDYHLSDKDNIYERYIFDPSTRNRPDSDPYWALTDTVGNYFAQIGETHIFSANAFNDFRAAFNRTQRDAVLAPVNPAIANLITPAMSFVPGKALGRLNIQGSSVTGGGAGLEVFGNNTAPPVKDDQNMFQESDTFALIRGPHSFKFGADLERYDFNTLGGGAVRDGWLFGGLQSLLQAQPTQLDTGKIVGAYTLNGQAGVATDQNGWRQWMPAWFVLDDWRVNSRLTLNLGLRQEFYTDPKEVNGLMGTLLPTIAAAQSTVGIPYLPAKLNFAPRIGLAWDPTGSGKTSIRASVGTFFNEVNKQEANGGNDYRFSASFTLLCNWTAGAVNPCAQFPYVPANPPLSTSKSETVTQYHLPTPTIEQYGIDIQHQLTPSMSFSVGYVGWYGYHLTQTACGNCNTLNPLTGLWTGPKINPAFGSITLTNADGYANYNALQAVFRRALSAGWYFQASYTFSKALSDSDSSANRVTDNTGPGGYVQMIPGDLHADYSRSAYDQRHLLVVNSLYQLPFGKSLKGRAAQALLVGWSVNGIWQYSSGLPDDVNDGFVNSADGNPIDPDRPNLNPGFSNNPTSGITQGCGGIVPAGVKLGTPNLWYNPCAFSLSPAGTFGNLGRNTVQGPSYNVWNVSAAKIITITERMKLQFRAEFFNLFNHPQFGLPSLANFQSNRQYVGTAGVMTDTTLPGLGGRNIQLGLKLTF